jgi:hypothetical protein
MDGPRVDQEQINWSLYNYSIDYLLKALATDVDVKEVTIN